jgi:hypothetical protein
MFLAAMLIFVPLSAGAQIVGSQGAPDTEHSFKSPMILQLPLPNVVKLPEGGSVAVSGIGSFTCDDVSIASLIVQHKPGSRHTEGKLVAELTGTIRVPDSYDRLVDVKMVVKKGEAVLGKTAVSKIDAEEGRKTPFRTTITFDASKIADAFSAQPPPILEITVVVTDNR